MKTKQQLINEIKASTSKFVTYGESDTGTPILKKDAIRDIMNMDEEMIGEGTWFECNSEGECE